MVELEVINFERTLLGTLLFEISNCQLFIWSVGEGDLDSKLSIILEYHIDTDRLKFCLGNGQRASEKGIKSDGLFLAYRTIDFRFELTLHEINYDALVPFQVVLPRQF